MPDVTPNRSFAGQWLAYVQAVAQYTNTLQFKVQWLRQHRSDDPIVQTQSEVIVALADMVQQLQQVIGTLPNFLPDTSGPRAAAQQTTPVSKMVTAPFRRP